ncbi:hypothetical protein GRZ55_14125 [Chelativorans sp. ZYF759]|uniref:HNH endonuclease signature motif containing protein n=1 Tax=Chelativorans sp. ZYF759 TaxID=2692213 RepID=UPI00145EB4E1|nr:HNH endonuclease signature motif containing protein [Chelativorans sp. ZYF759]NMG40381.1 hypothetical protein [Chelativorans sp. ZYF759]
MRESSKEIEEGDKAMPRSKDIPADLAALPRSPAEAKAVGCRYYFTGRPCAHGHVAARTAHNGTCQACSNARGLVYAGRAREAKAPERAAARAERQRLREERRQKRAEVEALGFDRKGALESIAWLDRIDAIGLEAAIIEREEKRRAAIEKMKQARLDRMQVEGTEEVFRQDQEKSQEAYWRDPERYRKRRRDRTARGLSGHRARVLRTPPWITKAEKLAIQAFYRECPEDLVVDHIIPIVHPLLAGLHRLANLQYLTARENTQKANRFDCTVEEAAEYVARGLAVWARDVNDFDGTINWSRYPPPRG